MGEGYAQKSPHLRNMEAEAYLLGNGFLVRDFEDSAKMGDKLMKEWKENNKKVLNEKKNKSNVQTLEKHAFFTKLVELAKKLKIDDAIEDSQLLSSFASSLGIMPDDFVNMLRRLKTDYTSDAKEAGALSGQAEEEAEPTLSEDEEENIKNHYTNRSRVVKEELMNRWFKGDKKSG